MSVSLENLNMGSCSQSYDDDQDDGSGGDDPSSGSGHGLRWFQEIM